jgi:RecJ-like exonuclease
VKNFVLLGAAYVASASFFFDDSPEITAEIAVEAAMDQFRDASLPSGVCENCRGTGKIGDGRIIYDCPACKGTGKSSCSGGVCPKN